MFDNNLFSSRVVYDDKLQNTMKDMVKIRRIIGITIVMLWIIGIVPKIIHGDRCRLVWQLDNWALIFAPVFTLVYAILLTLYLAKGKRWTTKLLEWFVLGVVSIVCVAIFIITGANLNIKMWSNKDYVVYDEFGDFSTPAVFMLYKRNGIVDDKLRFLRLGGWRNNGWHSIEKVEYNIYEPLDLIKEEADVSIDGDSTYHLTTFYPLSYGNEYDQSQNDSLLKLIENYH